MARFIEALLQERVWYWLEDSLDMEVDGEVSISTGRIDIVAKTSESEVWGIEVKRDEGLGFGSTLFEQMNRYIESEAFDRVFFASHKIDRLQDWFEDKQGPEITVLSQASKALGAGISQSWYNREEVINCIEEKLPKELLNWRGPTGTTAERYIEAKLDNPPDSTDPVPLDEGIRWLKRGRLPSELGIIHVPLNLSDGIMREVEKNIHPASAYQPRILREARLLDREIDPEFERREEPWIRHVLWREYGGIPEAHIPNVKESDLPHRPIDLIAFSGSYDPTDAVESPVDHEVIGFEAKGEGSFNTMRLVDQLAEYLETATLSRLYLAVPAARTDVALETLASVQRLEKVGLISVTEDGVVCIEREARSMVPENDGYMEKYDRRKLAFGDIIIEGGKDVRSPYVTDEEADRLRNPDATSYAKDLITDNSDMADSDGWIRVPRPNSLRPRESEFEKGKKARAYLLKGLSADPYVPGDTPSVAPDDMKPGYVRLTLNDFEFEGELALKFHFGRGSWEGGYIWFAGEEVRQLENVLQSLPYISGGEVSGQGKVLDLDTYPFDRSENEPHRVSGSTGEVEYLTLKIRSCNEGDVVAFMRLGEGERAGVDVEVTTAQWLDMVATIGILRNGTHRDLPGEYTSYPRIGPTGDDTWSIGTGIEEQVNPDPPGEWGT